MSTLSSDARPGTEEAPLPGRDLSPEHTELLTASGISAAYVATLAADGHVRSHAAGDPLPAGWEFAQPGLWFAWDQAASVRWQLRPDAPTADAEGRLRKYLWAKDSGANFGVVSKGKAGRVLIVEGTKQALAVASALAETDPIGSRWGRSTVIAIPGCWAWSHDGRPALGLGKLVRNAHVTVVLDADAASNRGVFDAGMAMREALAGATDFDFAWIGGSGKQGIDDILAGVGEPDRRELLEDLLESRHAKPAAKAPSPKTAAVQDFCPWSPEGKLLVSDVVDHLIRDRHWRVTQQGRVPVVYGPGYYIPDPTGDKIAGQLIDLLGNEFTTMHVNNIRTGLMGRLAVDDRIPKLPPFAREPKMSVLNGIVDLRTGVLEPHSPEFLTMRQVPVVWDPDAKCPAWEAWAAKQLGAEQTAVLEEGLAQMLDPSKAPSKAIYAVGPTRCGKSTITNIARIFVDPGQVSAVTLQMLTDSEFGVAELFGMTLNIAGDMSSDHVADTSKFAAVVGGEDLLQGNKKYGSMIAFENQALVMFTANKVATIGGDLPAYLGRILPVALVQSYLGSEDVAVGQAIRAEAPGILVRLVKAWQRQQARAAIDPATRWSPVPDAVKNYFSANSDRVSRFAAEACVVGVTESRPAPKGSVAALGAVSGTYGPATAAQLTAAFAAWSEREGGRGIGRKTLMERLRALPGVAEVRIGAERTRALNIEVLPTVEWDEVQSWAALSDALFGNCPEQPAPKPQVSDPVADGAGSSGTFSPTPTDAGNFSTESTTEKVSDPLGVSPGNCPNGPESETRASDLHVCAGSSGQFATGSLFERATALVIARAMPALPEVWQLIDALESGQLDRRKADECMEALVHIPPQLTVADAAAVLGIGPEAALPLLRGLGLQLADRFAVLEIANHISESGEVVALNPRPYLDPEAGAAVRKTATPDLSAFLILANPVKDLAA